MNSAKKQYHQKIWQYFLAYIYFNCNYPLISFLSAFWPIEYYPCMGGNAYDGDLVSQAVLGIQPDVHGHTTTERRLSFQSEVFVGLSMN